MNGSQEEQVDTQGTMYPENAAPDLPPTAEEIQEMADRLEVPTDVPGQLRALATDLDRIGKVLDSPAADRSQIEAAAELQRDIAECLRMVALRVPREEVPDSEADPGPWVGRMLDDAAHAFWENAEPEQGMPGFNAPLRDLPGWDDLTNEQREWWKEMVVDCLALDEERYPRRFGSIPATEVEAVGVRLRGSCASAGPAALTDPEDDIDQVVSELNQDEEVDRG